MVKRRNKNNAKVVINQGETGCTVEVVKLGLRPSMSIAVKS